LLTTRFLSVGERRRKTPEKDEQYKPYIFKRASSDCIWEMRKLRLWERALLLSCLVTDRVSHREEVVMYW
jgi:hypothetical protein